MHLNNITRNKTILIINWDNLLAPNGFCNSAGIKNNIAYAPSSKHIIQKNVQCTKNRNKILKSDDNHIRMKLLKNMHLH